MENNPIETMHGEHEIICLTAPIIEELKDTWKINETGYIEAVTQLIAFFRNYADGYHHRKEEDVLFPEIKNHPDFILHEILDEFEQHHEDFRDYTTEIEEALEAKEYERSHAILTTYIDELQDHIGAENDELFVLAESLMSEEELETIYFKFKDIDLELGEENKSELEQDIVNFAVQI